MSDETMLTIEQVETVINKVLDERALASQTSLQDYARKTDVHSAVNEIKGTQERVKILEQRLQMLEGVPKSLEMVSEQIRRTHDIAQSTNNLALRMAEVSQQNRARIDDLDRAQDMLKDEVTRSMKDFSTTLNDIEQRSMLTVESSKRMDAQMRDLIKNVQETQSMMSQFLVHQANEKEEARKIEATREELFEWVRARKKFEEDTGKRIKSILEFLFKDRLRAAFTLAVASVPVLEPIVNIVKDVIGG